jgi:hypothetical protein
MIILRTLLHAVPAWRAGKKQKNRDGRDDG